MKRNILSSLLLLAMLATTAPMVAQQHRLKATPSVSGFVSVDPSVATNRTTAFGRHLVERLKAEGVKLPMPEERLLRMRPGTKKYVRARITTLTAVVPTTTTNCMARRRFFFPIWAVITGDTVNTTLTHGSPLVIMEHVSACRH